MKSLLSFGVTFALIVCAGPLFAQSCCSGGTALGVGSAGIGSTTVQPIQYWQAPAYASPVSNQVAPAPASYSASMTFTASCCAAPITQPAQIQSQYYSTPIVNQTYSFPAEPHASFTPASYTDSSISTVQSNATASVPLIATPITVVSAPAASAPASSSGCSGCGCGCSKSVPCKCGH